MTPAISGHPTDDHLDTSLSGARAWFARQGLTRPREGRLLAGVTAGLVLTPLLYVPLWVLMPKDGDATAA